MNCCETAEEGEEGENEIEGKRRVTRGKRDRHDLSLIPLFKM